MKINVSYLIVGGELTFLSFKSFQNQFVVEHNSKYQVENGWIHHLDCIYIEIWHLWKTYSFLFFRFFIKKIGGIARGSWTFLIIIHTSLQINLFPLIYVNFRVKYFTEEMKLRDASFAGKFLAYIWNVSGVISGSSHKSTNVKPLQSRSN